MNNQEVQKLVKMTVTTELGAVYEFPDVRLSVLETLTASETLHGFTQLSIVNESGCCLVLPSRIIKTIAIEGEVKWKRSRA